MDYDLNILEGTPGSLYRHSSLLYGAMMSSFFLGTPFVADFSLQEGKGISFLEICGIMKENETIPYVAVPFNISV